MYEFYKKQFNKYFKSNNHNTLVSLTNKEKRQRFSIAGITFNLKF